MTVNLAEKAAAPRFFQIYFGNSNVCATFAIPNPMALSNKGLVRGPLKAEIRVRIPVALPKRKDTRMSVLPFFVAWPLRCHAFTCRSRHVSLKPSRSARPLPSSAWAPPSYSAEGGMGFRDTCHSAPANATLFTHLSLYFRQDGARQPPFQRPPTTASLRQWPKSGIGARFFPKTSHRRPYRAGTFAPVWRK